MTNFICDGISVILAPRYKTEDLLTYLLTCERGLVRQTNV